MQWTPWPQPKLNLVHFSFKRWDLVGLYVATILTIFPKINWPNWEILCSLYVCLCFVWRIGGELVVLGGASSPVLGEPVGRVCRAEAISTSSLHHARPWMWVESVVEQLEVRFRIGEGPQGDPVTPGHVWWRQTWDLWTLFCVENSFWVGGLAPHRGHGYALKEYAIRRRRRSASRIKLGVTWTSWQRLQSSKQIRISNRRYEANKFDQCQPVYLSQSSRQILMPSRRSSRDDTRWSTFVITWSSVALDFALSSGKITASEHITDDCHNCPS